MQTTKYSEPRQLGAVIKYESNPNYTRAPGTFTNSGDEAVQLLPGNILTGGATAALFDTDAAAAFTGINMTEALVQPGNTVNITYLANGEAIVNANEVDFPADAAQTETLKTAIANARIKLVDGNAD